MTEERYKQLLDEQYFPYIGMSLEDRNFYLEILKNCKDISDSENKVNGIGQGKLIEMALKKNLIGITASGSITMGSEYRCIEAEIYVRNKAIFVDMIVTRLGVDDEHKIYKVSDEFRVKDDKLIRKSRYGYKNRGVNKIIENQEMERKIR